MKCRACEIERNDEQVKQMPMHTCGKGGPVEYAQPKAQADKANEGREEKQPWTYDVDVHGTAFCFYKHNDFKFKANEPDLCKVLNEYEDLRDQLSKGREEKEYFRDGVGKAIEQQKKEAEKRESLKLQMDDECRKAVHIVNEHRKNDLIEKGNELQKEREMRKELEGVMKNIIKYGRETEYYIPPSLLGAAEDLIAKATELDKK